MRLLKLICGIWRNFAWYIGGIFVGIFFWQNYGIFSGKQAYSLITFVDVNECANFNETNAVHKVRLFDKILDSSKLANSTGTLTEISVELSPDWEPTIKWIMRWNDEIIARFGYAKSKVYLNKWYIKDSNWNQILK